MTATSCPSRFGTALTSPAFALGRPTGSASPLNWAEGQYLRLAQSIDAGYNLDTPSVVKAKYRGAGPIRGDGGKCIDDAGASTNNGAAIQILDVQRHERAELGLEQWRWHAPCPQQVHGCYRRRHRQRDAASALGLQRHRRAGVALATTDPPREPAVGQMPRCHQRRHQRRHAASDLGLQRHRRPSLAPSVDKATGVSRTPDSRTVNQVRVIDPISGQSQLDGHRAEHLVVWLGTKCRALLGAARDRATATGRRSSTGLRS